MEMSPDILRRIATTARQRARDWRREAEAERHPERRSTLLKWADNSEDHAAFYENMAAHKERLH